MKYKLRIFVKVAAHSSFTLAARELNLSQPAVSKAIARLEEDYHTSFFHRSRNSITLTNEGKIFLEYAKKILHLLEELENTFLSRQASGSGHFDIGMSTTIATYVMPKILARIQRSDPGMIFNITSANTRIIEQKILNQTLDYGIVEGKSSDQLLKYTLFIRDEIVLATRNGNTAAKSVISKNDLTSLPLISRETGSGTRDIIENLLRENKIDPPPPLITLDSTEATVRYLENSDAYALISIHAIADKLAQNQLKIIDIKGLTFARGFYFVCRTGYQSPRMDLLFQMIRTNYNF